MKKGQTRKPDTLKEPAQISTKVKQENKSLEKCWPVGGNQTLYESRRNENQTLYESRRSETKPSTRDGATKTKPSTRAGATKTKPSTRAGATKPNPLREMVQLGEINICKRTGKRRKTETR
jgi:hypothetical protein